MSEISNLYAKIQQLELALKGIGKTLFPVQEYIKPEIVKFTGHFGQNQIDLQPQELYNVATNYWFFIRGITATLSPDNGTVNLKDVPKMEFNLADSGRGYNFFEKPLGMDLFYNGSGGRVDLIDNFNGILIKDGANIRCVLSRYDTTNSLTTGYTVKIYLVGDYISPNYLAYYFHKIRKM